jgi:hypothetical protein
MESVIGLAYVAWQAGNKTAARAHINRFLALMENSHLEGFTSPAFNYGRAAEVLRGLGEEKLAERVLYAATNGV